MRTRLTMTIGPVAIGLLLLNKRSRCRADRCGKGH